MILFGVERLMKYKLKTRLFAALALSGVSFYWPATEAFAQENQFGFIRPAEPSRQDDRELQVPPITQANPPIVRGTPKMGLRSPKVLAASFQPPRISVSVVPASDQPTAAKASGPMPFAASNVFNGAYVESGPGNVGHAQHISPSQTGQQPSSRQVAYNESADSQYQSEIGSGIRAKRDLPPIVESAQRSARRVNSKAIKPMVQNEFPPIVSSVQEASDSAMPPIVTPTSGLDRLLDPIPAVASETASGGDRMIQDEFMIGSDGAISSETSKVEPAAFGAAPLVVQDAPPIIGGIDSVTPGSLPSADGVLVPVDPSSNLPSVRSVEPFPRATPLDSNNAVPQSVFDSGSASGSGTRNVPGAGSGTRNVPGAGSSTRNVPTYFDPSGQQPPAFSNSAANGCSTCGTSGVGGSDGSGVSACASCGENGCFDQAAVDAMFNTSGSNAYARQYFIAEALYLGRSDGDIFNSNRGSLSDFDFGGGARFTIGRREDSTAGREFQYSGTENLDQTITSTSTDGSIQSLFVPTGGLSGIDIPAFFNATEQEQSKASYFHSLEFNKVKWGWDVIKSYIGLRYIFFDDEYTLFSQNALNVTPAGQLNFPQSGEYQLSTTNNLIGPQIGGELYYDVGYRVSLSGFSRLGAYINFSQLNETLDNDGVRLVDEEDTNTTLSYTYEAGISAKYRLTQQSQFRVGYNLYFWDRLATVSDNIVNQGFGIPVGPSFFGGGTSDSDSIFINGVSFGFEFYR